MAILLDCFPNPPLRRSRESLTYGEHGEHKISMSPLSPSPLLFLLSLPSVLATSRSRSSLNHCLFSLLYAPLSLCLPFPSNHTKISHPVRCESTPKFSLLKNLRPSTSIPSTYKRLKTSGVTGHFSHPYNTPWVKASDSVHGLLAEIVGKSIQSLNSFLFSLQHGEPNQREV